MTMGVVEVMRFDAPGLVRSVPLLYDCARHELAIVTCTAGPGSELFLKTSHYRFDLTSTPSATLFPILVGMPHGSSRASSSTTQCDADFDAQKKAVGSRDSNVDNPQKQLWYANGHPREP